MDHEIDDAIIKFQRIADRRIEEAIKAGEFDNLKGAGQPISSDDDSTFVPPDMRAAFKVLSNSGYAPDWMVLAQKIDAALEALRYSADRHFAYLRKELAEVGSNPYMVQHIRREVERLKAAHNKAAQRHARSIEEINRDIMTFNNSVPIASLTRIPLSVAAEMQAFEDRLPAFLSYVK